MDKKSMDFSTTQLIMFLLIIILIFFMIVWYTGLKDSMIEIINNFF